MTTVARAIAAAVFRPIGSSSTWTSGSWSRRIRSNRRSVITVMSFGVTGSSSPARRRLTVRWRRLSGPSRGRNGFGRSGRLNGWRRVPLPPAMMTTYMLPHRSAASERAVRGSVPDAGALLADDDPAPLPDDPALPFVISNEVGLERGHGHVGVAPRILRRPQGT